MCGQRLDSFTRSESLADSLALDSNGTAKENEPVRATVQVFVYGTLTEPERVAALLGDGPGAYEFVGSATLEGLRRVDGRYPTLLPGGSVQGELLGVDEPALERLDRYEGVDRGLYVRVAVPRADGGSAQVYVGDPDSLGVATDGAWSDGRSLRASVCTHIVRNDVVVRRHE